MAMISMPSRLKAVTLTYEQVMDQDSTGNDSEGWLYLRVLRPRNQIKNVQKKCLPVRCIRNSLDLEEIAGTDNSSNDSCHEPCYGTMEIFCYRKS